MGSRRLPRIAPQPLRLTPPAPIESAPAIAVPDAWRTAAWPWPESPRLADILSPADNSFNVVRLLLALAVLISHTAYLSTGHHSAEPLIGLTGYSIGQYAVQGFFILSGLLVTHSLLTRGSLFDYARARALRIFPALVVCVLATAFIAGPALTFFGVPGYFMSSGVPNYVLQTLSLSSGSSMLPGVFALNPVGGVINESLWTLKYEAACYLLLAGMAALVWWAGNRRALTAVGLTAWAGGMLLLRPALGVDPTFLSVLAYFALFFGTGVAARLLAAHVRISWQPLAFLTLLFVGAWGTEFAELASAAFIGYGLLWLATLRFAGLRAFANARDYSYGTYLYAFPVTQGLLSVWPHLGLAPLLAATLMLTLVLAFMSWELIERPALSLVRRQQGRALAKLAPAAADAVVEEPVRTLPSEPAVVPTRAAANGATAMPAAPIRTRPAPAETAATVRTSRWRSAPVEAQPAPPMDRSRLEARMARITSARPASI